MLEYKIRFFTILLLLFFSISLLFSDSGKWIEVSIKKSFPTSISLDQARIDCLTAAREKAITQSLPENISISSLITNIYTENGDRFSDSTAKSIFSISSIGGYIINEEIISSQIISAEKSLFTYEIILKAKVKPDIGNPSNNLSMEINVNNNVLSNKDELIIEVTTNNDGFLYLFNFLENQTVYLINPNKYLPEFRINANQTIQIPSKKQRDSGLTLRVKSLPEKDVTIETIFAVFTINKIHNLNMFKEISIEDSVFDGEKESFLNFQKWLSNISLDQRIEKGIQIHIYNK